MGYVSYAENINDIRCDLEHFVSRSSESDELDAAAARSVIAAAERALRQIDHALEIATDPALDMAGEVARLRSRVVQQEKQHRADLERIKRVARDAAARTLETMYWRDAYLELSGRSAARCRRPPRRTR